MTVVEGGPVLVISKVDSLGVYDEVRVTTTPVTVVVLVTVDSGARVV